MAKKRPTLDAFLSLQTDVESDDQSSKTSRVSAKHPAPEMAQAKAKKEPVGKVSESEPPKSDKYEIVRHMLYLPLPIYDQLQGLIFEEQRGQAKRRKTHDYLLDAIDLLFKKKGLKPIAELTKRSE